MGLGHQRLAKYSAKIRLLHQHSSIGLHALTSSNGSGSGGRDIAGNLTLRIAAERLFNHRPTRC